MGRIRTVYLLCTGMLYELYESEAREGPEFFQRSRCVFPSVFEVPGGFFKFMKNRGFEPGLGQKQIVHEPNPLTTPYSAHTL